MSDFIASDGSATGIAPDTKPITVRLGDRPERPIRFRRTFDVEAGLRSAELRITALGIYQAECNGSAVGDHVLAPGWSSYHHRIRVQTHDITALLRAGANVLGSHRLTGTCRPAAEDPHRPQPRSPFDLARD